MQINLENADRIVDAYMPLLRANAFKFSAFDFDETMDESIMILIDAICEYDSTKGTFGNFLKLRLTYHFLDKAKGEVLLSLDQSDDKGHALVDTLISDDDLFDEVSKNEEYESLYRAMDRLNKDQRDIVYMKYFLDMKNAEIAKLMNLSYQTVANKASKSLKLLREFLE